MLNPNLKHRYKPTKKVIAQVFRHVIFGLIDLATITDGLAEKLAKKGYLVRDEAEEAEQPKPESKRKSRNK